MIDSVPSFALVVMTLLGYMSPRPTSKDRGQTANEQAARLVGRWRAIKTSEEWWADLYFPDEVVFRADGTYRVIHGPWSGQIWNIWKPGEIDVRMMMSYVTFALRFEGDELVLSLPGQACSKRYRRMEIEEPPAPGERMRSLLEKLDLWDDETQMYWEFLMQDAESLNEQAKAQLHRLLDMESLWSPETRQAFRELLKIDEFWNASVEDFLEQFLGPEETWDEATRLKVEVYRPLLLEDPWDEETRDLWREVLTGYGPLTKQIQMILSRGQDEQDNGKEARV